MFKNIRDVWYVFVGFWQCLRLLRRLRPDVVFVKGGFVGVPVGLAAAILRIPYVTHDSDAMPGLANRLIAPWARLHAVALPKEIYPYSAERTLTVGVPIAHHYQVLTSTEKATVRTQLGLPMQGRVLLVTGGGLGAQFINLAVIDCLEQLLERYPDLMVVQIVGRGNETDYRKLATQRLAKKYIDRVVIKGFISNMYQYSGAADIVITRAGGTSMAEFAAQAKTCVVIPNPLLAGGHQLKNAHVLVERKAIALLPEEKLRADHGALMPVLVDLFDNPAKSQELGVRLHKIAQSGAANRLAVVLLDIGNEHAGIKIA